MLMQTCSVVTAGVVPDLQVGLQAAIYRKLPAEFLVFLLPNYNVCCIITISSQVTLVALSKYYQY